MSVFGLIEKYSYPLTALLLLAITLLSLMPINGNAPAIPGSDKLHHLGAYALLMLPMGLRHNRHWWWFAIAFIAYSGAIELLQPFVERRAEWLDLLANSCGICLGGLLAMVIKMKTAV